MRALLFALALLTLPVLAVAQTATFTPTPTSTPTNSFTATPTRTPTASFTNTPTITNTPTHQPTHTNTATRTATPTMTPSNTVPPTAKANLPGSQTHVNALELTEFDGSFGPPQDSDACGAVKAAGNFPPSPADKCRCVLYIKNDDNKSDDQLCYMCSDKIEHCVTASNVNPTPTPH